VTGLAAPGAAGALDQARQRDVARRRQRVHQALASMQADATEITISAAARARVHRSFIHRHPDLHAAVLAAAAETTVLPPPASAAISHRSVLSENANLHEQNRRLSRQVADLEDRLSAVLGNAAFQRSGLGAPVTTASLEADLETQRQARSSFAGCWRNARRSSPPPAKPTAGS
jgi:hypothetical protein